MKTKNKKQGSMAVIETGGKQYLVKPGDVIRVEKIKKPEKDNDIFFEKILLLVKGGEINIGTPYLEKTKIPAKWLREIKGKKISHIRYHPKTRHIRRKGHRQTFSEVAIGNF